jgi:phenylalanyl-tRNA synthetase beta chain
VLQESLEQIGCDVEDVVEIGQSRCPQCESFVEHPLGQEDVKVCNFCGYESEAPFRPTVFKSKIRLDLLADRPDLFDVGGLARALRGTLGIETGLPKYNTKPSGVTVKVDKSVTDTSSFRPFIACAVMTLPPVDETSLVAIMKLQENLHWGVGRDRKLASIGVYDLSSISGDITYRTIDPDKDPFVPLGMPGKKMSGRQIHESHPQGVAYAELLADHKRYPVLVDAKGQVLSMPPIINSDETKLKQGSTRVFIDVTGISQAAVTKSLDTLVCSLAEIGGTIETVVIQEPDGTQRVTPDLTPRSKEISVAEAKRWLGLPLDQDSMAAALRKMRFDVVVGTKTSGSLLPAPSSVLFPAYRTDIRHMVDLFEDVAIGYGYANIEPKLVRSMTVGTPRPEETLSDRVRQVLIGLGFSEIMSLPLTTEEHQFERLGFDKPYPTVATIANPKLKAYNLVRNQLMPGLLEALHENRRRPMPQQLFEIDNTVNLDDDAETGASEYRTVAFAEAGTESGYATIRSACDSLMRELGWEAEYERFAGAPTLIDGRTAMVTVAGQGIGIIAEVHPQVLTNFGLTFPVAIAELTLQRVF